MKHSYRYNILFMMVLMVIINYIDRGAISYASEQIIAEFGFNTIAWGAVLGYFGYGYLFGALFGGALADKKGPKFVWIIIGIGWSIFVMATAFAGEIGIALFGGSALFGFAFIRILFGFFEGPTFSTINKTVANWATPKERGFAVSLGLLGTPLGAMLTAPVAVFLLSVTSWKIMFLFLAALGLIWVVIWTKMFTNLPEEHPKVTKEELEKIRSKSDLLPDEQLVEAEEKINIRWYHFFKNPTLVFNAIGYFAFQYINFLLLTWTPKYLQDEFGFQLSSLWYLGMIPWIGACFTVLLGGKLSDYLRMKTGNLRIARSGLAVVSLLLTACCFMLIPSANSIAGVMLLMTIGNAFNSLPNSVYWSVIIDTEPNRAGTFGGITHFITNTATIIAPTLTGFLVISYGYSSMFTAAAVASVIGMVAMLFVKPGKRKSKNIAVV
ncbi:MFS transporter [Lysinibacillus agricola]|uniref:MFS transporter n=1 Tax=Lysinibacillus agricola TaxID=2590012 RepID=A0ABX7AM88_9BACI|nr:MULTISPECIES: MFS transporter [Lysinibacillus]KOS59808.1 MFS transporter [Lysinibacillus sp. FJAT-14222]QQP10582.1 MFS transporter [Lysinibacillus agricola]